MAAKKEQKRSFESLMARLEEIVDLLELGDLPLDKAISLYEEGARISTECNDFLSETELKIKKLTKEAVKNGENTKKAKGNKGE